MHLSLVLCELSRQFLAQIVQGILSALQAVSTFRKTRGKKQEEGVDFETEIRFVAYS